MMNPKLSQESLCRILVILVLVQIQVCICQTDPLYETCRQQFRCANLGDIKYPFYGHDRPVSCGYPGFELDCQTGVPLITINSTSYRVLSIDNNTYNLKVARDDLMNNICPETLRNTTLNNLFSFSSNYNDQNITLNYGCSTIGSQPLPPSQPLPLPPTQPQQQNPVFNNFSCAPYSWNMVWTTEQALFYKNFIVCSSNIFVPVNQTAASTLTALLPIVAIRDALASGFWIQWWANNSICQGCEESGGVCGSNQDSESFACYCSNGTYPSSCNSSANGKGISGPSTLEKVLIGMAIFVPVVVSATFIIAYLKRQCRLKRLRNGLNQETNPDVENFLMNNEYLTPKRYKYSQIKKITKSFRDKLGQGGYGSVYNGMLPNGQIVAVKLLTETKSNGADFINEVASISKTSHVNIVNLLGFCYERNRSALVYEFMPNKSLDKFISTNGSLNTDFQLDLETLFKIAVGVARGLEYLHKGCNTRIVHFDIKPQNILLDEEFCPKISDFGLAKLCKKRQSVLSIAGTRGTIGYIAPEVFSRNFGGVSHKSDVYSYGMMVLEMAGARNITGMGTIQSSENYFPDKIYQQVIIQENQNLNDIASGEEVEVTRKMFLVGFWCIQTVPSDRPSMSKVVDMLEGSLQSIQIPPKPYLFNPPKLGQGFSSSSSGNLEIEISMEGLGTS